MKKVISILISLMVLASISQSQQDINYYTGADGEVIFVTGTISQSLSSSTPKVAMRANGAVFNDEGVYSPTVSANCNERSTYAQLDSIQHSHINMQTTRDGMVEWESAYDGDAAASATYCPGMLGWGDYLFTVSIDNTEKHFSVSTIDGRWMTSGFNEQNKIIFYVDFLQENQWDPITINIKVYNWDAAQWETVTTGDRVTFWDVIGNGGRNRTTIAALSNAPFKINSGQDVYLRVPFNGVTSNVFDIDLTLNTPILIDDTCSVEITDYYDPESNSFTSSTWLCDVGSRIVNEGNLEVYSNDPEINNKSICKWGVQLFPKQVQALVPRKSWEGVLYNGVGSSGYIENSRINKATEGIRLQNANITIARDMIDSCESGIVVSQSTLIGRRDTVLSCGRGIGFEGTGVVPSLVDSCQINNSTWNGIQFNRSYKKASSRQNPVIPSDNVVIRNNEIKYNQLHGIEIDYSNCEIRGNNISRNGWRWGVMPSTISIPYGSGIYNYYGDQYVTRNDFSSNTGYGIHNYAGSSYALADSNQYGDAENLHGENCFDQNLISLYLDTLSWNDYGDWYASSDSYFNDANSIRNPRWRDPVTQRYVNVYCNAPLLAQFDHNYWLPSTGTWCLLNTMNFSAVNPIFDPDSVRCGDGYSFTEGVASNLSANASRLVHLMEADSIDAAYEYGRDNLSDNLDEKDAGIFTWVLAQAKLYAGIDSAMFLLENQAFTVLEAQDPSALDMLSLSQLQRLYVILDDSTNAWKAYDTLLARQQSANIILDSAAIAMYRDDLYLYIDKDTSSATALIDSLYKLFPGDQNIFTRYVDLTGDTTIYSEGLEKGSRDNASAQVVSPREFCVFGCYPNPFNPTATIQFYLPSPASVTIMIYDAAGRAVYQAELGMRMAGMNYFQFDGGNTPSGGYIAVLDNGSEKTYFKLVLQK